MPYHPPRAGDLPREEIMRRASEAIAVNGGPANARVFFKFTCPHCGERCQFVEPNQLFEDGECSRCGRTAPVPRAGYALLLGAYGHENH